MIARIAIVIFITLLGGLIGFFTAGEGIAGEGGSIIISNTMLINNILNYALVSLIGAVLLISIEYVLTRKGGGKQAIFSFLGMILGIISGYVLGISIIPILNNIVNQNIIVIFQLILGYIGFIIGWFKSEEIGFLPLGASNKNDKQLATNKILDTSVIIDGRISDIAETGFLEGELIVPKFVLKELQQVADSPDPLKRSRGRRGLDILNDLRQSKKAIIRITDEDFTDVKEVDNKLLKLAKHMQSVVVTNDFNLNRIAEFQGVKVLNVNELSNAVKPIVLPNEQLSISVIKEGKDQQQGIAYLDDGTMIVVDNGKDKIGQEVVVVVTSILQTPAGRMIFTQLVDDKENSTANYLDTKNNYSSYNNMNSNGRDSYHHTKKK